MACDIVPGRRRTPRGAVSDGGGGCSARRRDERHGLAASVTVAWRRTHSIGAGRRRCRARRRARRRHQKRAARSSTVANRLRGGFGERQRRSQAA